MRSRFLVPLIYFIYCLPAVPLSAMGILYFVHLPKFHSSSLGVALATISGSLLLSRSWDAITDPAIGYLSDRIRKPFLRRPVWVLGGALSCSLVFAWVSSASAMKLFGVESGEYFVLSALFFLFYTIILIPYESWALEIFTEVEKRTRIIMLREGATLCGTLVAGALPVALSRYFQEKEEIVAFSGLLISVFLLLSAALVVFIVPYPRALEETNLPRGPIRAVKDAFSLKVFRILLFAFCLTTIAAQIPAALILFFVEDVLGVSDSTPFVLQYFIGAGIGFPFWLYAARRVNKADLWIIGVLLNTIFFFFVIYLPAGATIWYSICVVGSGLGLGGILAIPTAIQADIIEFDCEQSKERREGSFVGLWAIVRKLSAAIGVAGVLYLLAKAGYEPEETASVTPAMQTLIRYLYCLLPCLLNFGALFFIFRLKEELKLVKGYSSDDS
ncbi:MAG: MFS transporter [Bdellovibrionales bacterium]|nr:MFS transporter [Bdellovibrionales bacterium]